VCTLYEVAHTHKHCVRGTWQAIRRVEAGRIEKREKTIKCHAPDVEPVWIGIPTSLNGTGHWSLMSEASRLRRCRYVQCLANGPQSTEHELPLSTFYPLGGVIEIL
jgi:hypothetical protein